MARYPQIEVRIESRHPLALVAAVRHGLRRAGVGPEEIARFSSEAFRAGGGARLLRVVDRWVERIDESST